MTKINQPSKELVRKWLLDHLDTRKPLPDATQIRRQLEWECQARPVPEDFTNIVTG